MEPQTLLTPEMQKIIRDAASSNMGKSRTLRQISRTGVCGSTPIHSGISKNSTPASSDNSGIRIPIGISSTSATPISRDLWSPWIGNKQKPTSPNIINSNNWTLLLMEISPIILLRHPFSLNYSMKKSPTVPAGISICAVGCSS